MKFGNSRVIRLAPTVDTGAYTAGDVIGGVQTIDALGATFGRGVLKNVTIGDGGNQRAALTLLFFEALPDGTYTDQAAVAPSVADLAICLGKVEIAADDYTTVGARAVATKECSTVLRSATDLRRVYVVIVAGGTPTYSAANLLKVALGVLLD